MALRISPFFNLAEFELQLRLLRIWWHRLKLSKKTQLQRLRLQASDNTDQHNFCAFPPRGEAWTLESRLFFDFCRNIWTWPIGFSPKLVWKISVVRYIYILHEILGWIQERRLFPTELTIPSGTVYLKTWLASQNIIFRCGFSEKRRFEDVDLLKKINFVYLDQANRNKLSLKKFE